MGGISRSRRRSGSASMLACAFVLAWLAGCGSSSALPTSPQQVFSRAQYHFAITLAANWTVYDQQDNPAANAPYSMAVQRLNVSPAPLNSSLNFQVSRITPDLVRQIAGYATDTNYHVSMINGVRAYISTPHVYYITPPTLAPGMTSLPATTPAAGSPDTYIHTDYAVPTATFLYTFYTEAVVGDNADNDLNAMAQSLTITP